ncbi:hypothetical protein FPV67DRAFT_1782723 [Lyophyllum atratum]|nr:hypothetical protein FPV67DRAFT_1782723 [Lyophyllum atratum]
MFSLREIEELSHFAVWDDVDSRSVGSFKRAGGDRANVEGVHVNEVYRSFSANQAPFILADFILPTESCDINVSPDKRTILLHSEGNLIIKLKTALEEAFAPSRSTYDVGTSQSRRTLQSTLTTPSSRPPTHKRTRSEAEEADVPDEHQPGPSKKRPPPPRPPVAHAEDEELDGWEDHAMSSEPLLLSDDMDLGIASSAEPPALSDPPAGPVVSPTVSQLTSGRASHRPEGAQPALPSSSSPSPPASPTVTQMVDARRAGRDHDIDDRMDVDQGDRPQSEDTPSLVDSPERGRAAAVVVDTTQAAWNRVAALEKDVEQQEEEEPQNGEKEEREEKGPPPKKKKDAPPVGRPSGRQAGSRSGGSGKESQTGRVKFSAKMSRDGGDDEEGEQSHEENDSEEEDMYRGNATSANLGKPGDTAGMSRNLRRIILEHIENLS